jgi:hypothetical protein
VVLLMMAILTGVRWNLSVFFFDCLQLEALLFTYLVSEDGSLSSLNSGFIPCSNK